MGLVFRPCYENHTYSNIMIPTKSCIEDLGVRKQWIQVSRLTGDLRRCGLVSVVN
jgi:hypothetical protein